jgi:hypothetical protein
MYRVYSEIKNEFQFPEIKTQEYKEAWALLLRKVGRKNAEKYKLTIKKEEVLNPSSLLNFGKHKGKRVHQIIEEDPEYLIWLSKNSTNKLNEDVKKIIEIKLTQTKKLKAN